MKFKTLLILVCISLLTLTASFSEAVPIDLNDFSFYAGDPVVIASDGSSATLSENASVASVPLWNDPFFGDPGVVIPVDAVSLTFDYSFTEGSGNQDEFLAFLFDDLTYPFALNDSNGDPLELWLDSSQSSSVTWDLTGSSLLGSTVGMEFQLNALDFATGSYVTISNVNVNTAPIPEPATLILLGSGLAGLGVFRKKYFCK